jgi:predicted transcriptional regulator of viral defense system
MPETNDTAPHDRLYELAEQQAGYFRAEQAVDAGIDHSLLRKHARPGGRFEPVDRGLYRLRRFPASPHEHVVAAWVAIGPPAVVSHESALEIHDLSDAIPTSVHLTLPREYRGRRSKRARLHFTQRPLESRDVRTINGLPVTSPERSIADALEAGSQPEQIELAIRQALDRGLTTPGRLRSNVQGRPRRVRDLIERAAATAEEP